MQGRSTVPGVDAATPLAEAAPAILLAKVAPLLELEIDARATSDSEAVHDMRVASRRLREAMRLLAPVYKSRVLSPWRARVRAITSALGPVRDADVFIEALTSVRASLDEGGQRAVAFLVGYSLGQRGRDSAGLDMRLPDIGLLRDQHRFEGDVRRVRDGKISRRSLSWLARDAIASRATAVTTAQARALDGGTVEEYHALRIAYKHLRYAVEIFAPCYGEALIGLQDTLREFQDALGELHDAHVFSKILAERYRDGSAERAGVDRRYLDAVLAALAPSAEKASQQFAVLVGAYPADVLTRALRAPFGEDGK